MPERGMAMRALVSFLLGILSAALVAAFGVLAAQNGQGATLAFLGNSVVGSAGELVALAALVGFVLAALLAISGRVATAGQRRTLARQLADTQERLTVMREQYAELHGDYQRLYEEHWHLLSRVAVTTLPGDQASQSSQPSQPVQSEPLASQDGRLLRRTGPLYPPGQAPRPFAVSSSSGHAGEALAAQPPLVERVKAGWGRLTGRFRRQPATADDGTSGHGQDSSAA